MKKITTFLIIILILILFKSLLCMAEESPIETANRLAREQTTQNQSAQAPQPAEQSQTQPTEETQNTQPTEQTHNESSEVHQSESENNQNQNISEDDFQKLINIGNGYYQHMNKLIGIFNLDVYNFFDIHNQSYNQLSPLKKRVYERSPEYKKLLEKLKILKKKLMEEEFTLHIPYQREYFFEGLLLKSEYNVRRKRFELFIGKRNMVTKSLAGPWIQSKLPATTYEASYDGSNPCLGFVLKMSLHHYYAGESNAVIFTSTNLILYHYFNVSEQTALKIEKKGKVKIFFRLLVILKCSDKII